MSYFSFSFIFNWAPFDNFFEIILSGEIGLMLSSLPLVKPIRLTKLEQSQFSLSEDLKSILVGLLLGDLCAQKRTIKGNTCLHFEQGLVHKDYIYHLYELFEPYCRSVPKTTNRLPDKRTGKIYSSVKFNTYSLPCFNEFYNLFYPEGNKIIPKNMWDLMTPLSLAYWIADDGSVHRRDYCFVLCSDSYSLTEVTLLTEVLAEKFRVKCNLYSNGNGFRIRIPKTSLPVVQALLKDIMPGMMKYPGGHKVVLARLEAAGPQQRVPRATIMLA